LSVSGVNGLLYPLKNIPKRIERILIGKNYEYIDELKGHNVAIYI